MAANADYSRKNIGELLDGLPYVADFFASVGLHSPPRHLPLGEYLRSLPRELVEDIGLGREELLERFTAFMAGAQALQSPLTGAVESVTVIGGRDKGGRPEEFALELLPGQVTCIVGPTGSGKSRFLADIEWLAQGDTPTGRRILVNGKVPETSRRYAVEQKLVAQLSQNMNFVMDLTVEEFVTMHAESRLAADVPAITRTIIGRANELAGEPFAAGTPVTALSGGQSRALMIADTACLSHSPIVLIDEIENAGIDRKRAVATLVDNRKIVLMATHDPILALMGERRLVFKNGGIARIIETSPAERSVLARLEALDRELAEARRLLRSGGRLGESS